MTNATRDYIDERDRELRNRATANYSALQRQIDALILRQNTTAKFAEPAITKLCDVIEEILQIILRQHTLVDLISKSPIDIFSTSYTTPVMYEPGLPCDSGGQGQVSLYSPSANPKTVWGLLA